MVDRKACPICESASQQPFLTAIDYSVSQETFTIVKCKDCGFHFTNPVPENENIGKYYK